MKTKLCAVGIGILLAATHVSVTEAQVPGSAGDPVAGRLFALQSCTSCHIVAPGQANPEISTAAPAFKAIANAQTTTVTGLHVFLISSHPTMPDFVLSDDQRENVIAYILSLRTRN